MSKDYSNYIRFLASRHHILYIGRKSEEIYNETCLYFASSSKIDMTEALLNKMGSILIKRKITVVVIDATSNDALAESYYEKVQKYDKNIFTLLIYDPKQYHKVFDIVPYVDAVVTSPIERDMFHKKLFTLLSRCYAVETIAEKEIIQKKENITEDSLDAFFDIYKGSALFLSDDIEDMVQELDAGNLSHALFRDIAQKLDEIAVIFSKTQETKSVVPLYKELASYLKTLDLESISVENLHGFSYLSNILSDVSLYLKEMFVDEIFRDVSIFTGSMQSNIVFLQSALSGEKIENNRESLDFFE